MGERFAQWLEDLRNLRARARVQFRPVRFGISELRINYGPGYRVYYQQKDSKLIILLAGGDKSSQSWDIEEALILARQIKEDG
ncbi:type II toxin-antitoxin system RelE/ParE family toxin [Cyanobium sp. HWJ4-Hawea]|uniref:type II toxin-antitoxin system RelE/ParE family toxin n=1 Tax=Cyanobium sp. HWJ4-Hawea TaxID=2823713 RepID=UPI0039656055|nr:type II toxin-antitoxin system RelE/ParE family toxin [Cyanobium sp. HWJ4-Hawea]